MSSFALPTRTSTNSSSMSLGAEADLARRASRADQGAFEELFGRHHQTMWRLAQALTPDREAAAAGVSDGFVRVLRQVRRRQADLRAELRPSLLAGVYRAGMDLARKPGQAERDAAAVAARRHGASAADEPGVAEDVLAAAAFRSLPERWRAALWLHEVEGMAPERMAAILGVSASVATALIGRAHRGMSGRFGQAGLDVPVHLGPSLRPVAGAVPTGLADVAVARWRIAVAADPTGRFVPATGWLAERAPRPLGIACGGLLAVGVIGLGVLSQHTGVVSGGPVALSQAPGQHSRLGVTSPGAVAGGGGSSLLLLGADPYGIAGLNTATLANFSMPGGIGSASPLGSSGAALLMPNMPASSPSSGGGSPPAVAPAGSSSGPAPAPAPVTNPVTNPITAPITVPVTTPPTPVSPVVTVPGVATVAGGGGTATIHVLPTPSGGGAVQVNLGSCTGVNLLGTPVGCQTTTATTTATTPATTAPPATSPSTAAAPAPSVTPPAAGLLGGILGKL